MDFLLKGLRTRSKDVMFRFMFCTLWAVIIHEISRDCNHISEQAKKFTCSYKNIHMNENSCLELITSHLQYAVKFGFQISWWGQLPPPLPAYSVYS